VDDGIGTLERDLELRGGLGRGQVDGVPRDVAVPARHGRRTPRDADHVVAGGQERPGQRRADVAARTGDCHSHERPVPDGRECAGKLSV
jgi:hypothetical protein